MLGRMGLRIVLAAAVLWGMAGPVIRADGTAPELTTDSAHYCTELEQRLGSEMMGAATPDAIRLSDEGRQLCDSGHVHAGIIRLRRAVVLLHEQRK